jgi:hypothetical protein
MDKIREERVRRMVLNPDTWPNDMLSMKKLGYDLNAGKWGTEEEDAYFGVIKEPVDPKDIRIFSYGKRGKVIASFDSIDRLIEAGWCVDSWTDHAN